MTLVLILAAVYIFTYLKCVSLILVFFFFNLFLPFFPFFFSKSVSKQGWTTTRQT